MAITYDAMVQIDAINTCINTCGEIIKTLKEESDNLENGIKNAHKGWNDSKYEAAKKVVDQCSNNLKAQVQTIEKAQKTLEDLSKKVKEYNEYVVEVSDTNY